MAPQQQPIGNPAGHRPVAPSKPHVPNKPVDPRLEAQQQQQQQNLQVAVAAGEGPVPVDMDQLVRNLVSSIQENLSGSTGCNSLQFINALIDALHESVNLKPWGHLPAVFGWDVLHRLSIALGAAKVLPTVDCKGELKCIALQQEWGTMSPLEKALKWLAETVPSLSSSSEFRLAQNKETTTALARAADAWYKGVLE